MGDLEYAAIVRELLLPLARAYQPELVLVSAGFDIHAQDPLGGMRVSPQGFAWLTRLAMELAVSCQGRLVLLLEGGYCVDGQAESVAVCVRELLGRPGAPSPEGGVGRVGPILEAVRKIQAPYWRL
jgi:acetoin utilization deacetylase AcuC-like enzyme